MAPVNGRLLAVDRVATDLEVTAANLRRLRSELSGSTGHSRARLSLDLAQELRKVNKQQLAVEILAAARQSAKNHHRLLEDINHEIAVQEEELSILKQLQTRWDKLPEDILVLIGRECEDGALLKASRICHSWRTTLLGDRSLWQHLVVTPQDHNPHLKATAYTKRAGSLGLRTIDLDMSFDFDNPRTHPKRVSARNNARSTFQRIIHAVDSNTKRGTVHNLDLFRYYTAYSWHGFDIAYILRLLVRPYIQPTKVEIWADDVQTSFDRLGTYMIPLLPAFNPRLREIAVGGRTKLRWRFGDPDESGTLASRLTALKVCNVSRDFPKQFFGGDFDSNLAQFVRGLHAAAASRPEYVSSYIAGALDCTYEPCAPGDADRAEYRAESLSRGWTTIRYDDRTDPVTGPSIFLPNVVDLIVGTKDLGFLTRLETPRLTRLGVSTPLWLWGKRLQDAIEGDAAHHKLTDALRKNGLNLRVLDLRDLTLKSYPFLDAVLHELCPHLEVLIALFQMGRPDDYERRMVSYIQAKRSSTRGTRRLKTLVACPFDWTPEGRDFLRANVDEVRTSYSVPPEIDERDEEWASDMQHTSCAYADHSRY